MWWMTPTYIDENLLIGLRRSSAVTDQQRRASVGLAVTSEDGAQRSAVVVLVAEGHNGPVRPGRTPVFL
jgi:hypothetical protein